MDPRNVINMYVCMYKDTSQGRIHHFLRPVPPALLLDYSAGRISRELWWTNQEFSPARISPGARCWPLFRDVV
jgi:hypothetical protein